MTEFKNFEKIVYGIANSFSRSTGQELEELIGEGFIAYCEALQSYKSDKGMSKGSWIFQCVQRHLISWNKQQPFSLGGEIDIEIETEDRNPARVEFINGLKILSRDAQKACDIIFATETTRKQDIERTLREKESWSWKRIWITGKEIKEYLRWRNAESV